VAGRPRFETEPVPPLRLQALADGVFAIAMTLLVFQLGVPLASEVDDNAGLAEAMGEMWPEFLIYGLSFLVLGLFWLIHHMLFDAIERYDTTLVWLNVGYLMVVALIPYSTALFGEHGPETVTALVYGVNMLLAVELAWAIMVYATGGRRLVASDYDPALARGGTMMGRVYTVVMLVPLAVSFPYPAVAFGIYGAFVVTFIGFTLLGRWDVVTVWPGGRAGDSEVSSRM
jgi:uncharacterized membrane protein